jgi:NTP pyrophosphatase (non-canonical NTP hydrolase)
MQNKDKLNDIFERQAEFMKILLEADKLPEWPVNISSKQGQRIIREYVHNIISELEEAVMTLKNKVHRVSNDTEVDVAHYREEIGDALAYFIEVCILSGMSAEDLYKEYCLKNEVVKHRFKQGY